MEGGNFDLLPLMNRVSKPRGSIIPGGGDVYFVTPYMPTVVQTNTKNVQHYHRQRKQYLSPSPSQRLGLGRVLKVLGHWAS